MDQFLIQTPLGHELSEREYRMIRFAYDTGYVDGADGTTNGFLDMMDTFFGVKNPMGYEEDDDTKE